MVEDSKSFEVRTSLGRLNLFNVSFYVISVSVLGRFIDILVTPEDAVWLGMLIKVALFKAICVRNNPVTTDGKTSRWVFFLTVFLCLLD